MDTRSERYLNYKKNVLDQVSPSFCAAKWLNATIWLDRGATTSCHHPPSHQIPLASLMRSPSAIHNTNHKKEMRRQMLQGIRPKECDYCWKIEDVGPHVVSDRVFKSMIYSAEDILRISRMDAKENVDPRTLEISFGRACQFACSYCNDSFSTTWAKDLKQHGPYSNFKTKDAKVYQRKGLERRVSHGLGLVSKALYQVINQFRKKPEGETAEYNPYVEAFWSWWPRLSDSLTELRVTGGEPLLSPDFWKLVDRFRAEKPKIRLAINSNLGAKPELIERLAKVAHELPTLELYTSCEAHGAQAEYLRDGLNYEQWKKNVLFLRRAGLQKIHVMMTINALCLFSITDLFNDILSWRREYDRHLGIFTLNILRFPAFMNVLVLPLEVRFERAQHLKAWVEQHRNDPLLHDMEIAEIIRLIEYLEKVPRSHEKASGQEDLWHDFISFYQQYDRRRKKSLSLTFPELAPLLSAQSAGH